jgi:predicted fused transcriptional regulator/phosphomethylpyrimidine kinase
MRDVIHQVNTMQMPQRSLAATRVPMVLLSLAFAVPSAAEVVDVEWGTSGTFSRTVVISPAKFAEVCGALKPGESVRWSFASDQPLDFNVHYHVGTDVRYPEKQEAVAALQGRLDVTDRQTYCWMWSNRAASEARVQFRLAR